MSQLTSGIVVSFDGPLCFYAEHGCGWLASVSYGQYEMEPLQYFNISQFKELKLFVLQKYLEVINLANTKPSMEHIDSWDEYFYYGHYLISVKAHYNTYTFYVHSLSRDQYDELVDMIKMLM